MLHFAHQGALQADHVGRKRVIQYLAAAVIEHLVTKSPPSKNGVQIVAVRTFAEKAYARLDTQFIDLERFHELQLFGREFAQARAFAQWT
jgi:hypothetical protein